MITVFYSWQSDLPSKANRYFIQDALKKAIKEINKDISIELEVRFDQDTKGITGSPDITHIIFDKIANSDIFVGDISITNQDVNPKRLSPNPNVLVEYGYALRHLGWENVISVFNTAYGNIVDLPFDLNHRRPLSYHRTEEKREKSDLSNDLQSAILAIINRSKNLIKISKTKIVQSLIGELEDNLYICNNLNATSPSHFEDNKYKQAKENDLRSLIPDLYESLRSVYMLFSQTNNLINQLRGDATKDYFTTAQITEFKQKIPSEIKKSLSDLENILNNDKE